MPESHIVELADGFPGDLDLTLNWKPETDLAVVPIDDQVSSHAPKSNVVGSPARLRNNEGAQGRW